jgi:predicted alpha/beta superfamily hydrolase
MKQHFLFYTLLLSLTSVHGQFDTKMKVEYSKNVGDSFEIYISLPPTYNLNDTYSVVYYCDANLKSGRHLQELISTSQYNNLQNTIFVGIGHIGNYHVLRRRDFILSTINGNDTVGRDKNYGQTEKFYSYLKNELVQSINSKFKTNIDSNSILGHSLGGLFAFFCLFKSDNLFSKYFALSPALWIDKYSIYRFNHVQTGFSRNKYLYFASGSKETVNKILKGTNEAKVFLDKKQYANLTYDYDIWSGKTHNSEVPLSLEKILKEKL